MNNNDHFWLDLAAIKYLTDDKKNTHTDTKLSPTSLLIFGIVCIAISIWILRTI